MNPLDLRGPAFLAFYVIAFIVAIGVAMTVRSLFRRGGGTISHRQPTLGALELAYLAGGGPRTVQAALVSLAHRGAIAVDPKGKIVTKGNTPLPQSAGFEGAIFNIVRLFSPASPARLTAQCSSALRSLEAQLVGAGLVLPGGTRVLAIMMGYVILLIVPILGIAKIGVGLERNRPVGFLVMALVVSVVVALIVGRPFRRTAEGDRVLKEQSQQHLGLKSKPSDASNDQLMLGVALFGPALLAGTALDSFHRPLRQAGSMGDGGSGSSCGGGGGGSSCGGGGGCGGCGGGD